MTAAPVRLAMLHTRAAPSARIHDDWVAWLIDEHMPQLTAGSPLLGSWCYRSSAARSTAGPHYMVSYVAPDLATLREWLASPRLEAALADGLRWVGEFDALEGETFTGNVYVRAWASPGADAQPWREECMYDASNPPGMLLISMNGPPRAPLQPRRMRWRQPLVLPAHRCGRYPGCRHTALWSAGNRMIVCGLAGSGLPAEAAARIGALHDLQDLFRIHHRHQLPAAQPSLEGDSIRRAGPERGDLGIGEILDDLTVGIHHVAIRAVKAVNGPIGAEEGPVGTPELDAREHPGPN